MNTKHDFCPGCGAQVYPEEAQCPFCGRSLRSGFLTPVLVGLAGTAAAFVSGALVWWVLSSPAPQSADGGTPAAPQAAPAPQAPPALSQNAAQTAPAAPAQPPLPQAPSPPPPEVSPSAPAMVPPPAPQPSALAAVQDPRAAVGEPAPAAPADQLSFAPLPGQLDGNASPRVAVVPPSSLPADEAGVGTPESRRAFAKSKQDSFAQNGLDLQVSTSGAQDTVLVIKFNFSAKTAAELISTGPFPKQCKQQGFTEILFEDPSGATWAYDIASQKMSVR